MRILLTGANGYIGKRLLPVLVNMGHCDRVSGGAAVLMMQTADVRESDDRSQVGLLDRSLFWALFVQRKMRSRRVIVRKVGAKKSLEMKFVEDDDMIEALATY